MPLSRPRFSTIPLGYPFIETLANGLLEDFANEPPEILSSVTILLPNQHAARSLREAFEQNNPHGAILLPAIHAIADFTENKFDGPNFDRTTNLIPDDCALPSPITPIRRRLLLATLLERWWTIRSKDTYNRYDHALRVAEDLANVMDQIQTSQLGIPRSGTNIDSDIAVHWQETIMFLRIITEQWPQLLAERDLLDPAMRRNLVIQMLTQSWEDDPPQSPIIIAGTTSSVPALLQLISAVAGLPFGKIILQGVDKDLEEQYWQILRPSHPQYALKCLLDHLNLTRDKVTYWDKTVEPEYLHHRRRVLTDVMSPGIPSFADNRASQNGCLNLAGLQSITCPDQEYEATIIAMLMNEAIKAKGSRCVLVTSDPNLIQRVKVEAKRWQLIIDDTAGTPVSRTLAGVFFHSIADFATNHGSFVSILSLLKHPLSAGGLDKKTFQDHVRRLELFIRNRMRISPNHNMKDILQILFSEAAPKELIAWFQDFLSAARNLLELTDDGQKPLGYFLQAHMTFAEWLATELTTNGRTRIYNSEGGHQIMSLMQELILVSKDAPDVISHQYASVFSELLFDTHIQPTQNGGKRLCIWAPIEVRLQQPDLVIISDCNEGTWPPQTNTDSWLSQSIRQMLGLPDADQLIGLAAHEFSHLFCTPNVILIRSSRKAGLETVPSRWLIRLEAALKNNNSPTALIDKSDYWLERANLVDKPEFSPARKHPPSPCPPVQARPRRMSVTRIERWMKNPYEVFARDILKLYPLESITIPQNASYFGTLVHEALAQFEEARADQSLVNSFETLIKIGHSCFLEKPISTINKLFWWPRFERIAKWYVAFSKEHLSGVNTSFSECEGEIIVETPRGPFVITARADWIHQNNDGTLDIIDFKTGALPSTTKLLSGDTLQLPLEAAIARSGGFTNVPASRIRALVYIRLSGYEAAGEYKELCKNLPEVIDNTLSMVREFVASYDDTSMTYRSAALEPWDARFDPYRHLSRAQEWASWDPDP